MDDFVKNFKQMATQSIGLTEDWEVLSSEFKTERGELEIRIGAKVEAEFKCPECGRQMQRYGYERGERRWRHSDTMFYPTYICCQRPRCRCEEHGVQTVKAPWARKSSRFTLMFEGYAMLMASDMPVMTCAKRLGIDPKAMKKIINYWVKESVNNADLSGMKSLAVDETSFKKGQEYVTLMIDADERRVVSVYKGRDSETLAAFAEELRVKGGQAESIRTATSDMGKAFVSGVKANFPNAKLIIDKFHLKQLMNNALDEVRKSEQAAMSDKQTLFRGRKLFMIARENMTIEQVRKLNELSKLYEKTGRAYRIVHALDVLYGSATKIEAEMIFERLLAWLRRSRLEPFVKKVKTLLELKDEILNYFDYRRTNAICEGLNSIVQAAKRRARGFHTLDGFCTAIYLAVGKLKLACPNPHKVLRGTAASL